MEHPAGLRGGTSTVSFTCMLLLALSLPLFVHPVSCCTELFMLNSGCTCPGYTVTFTCSIVGGGNTIWNGSAFHCPSGSDSENNQILLLHSRFGTDQNPSGDCNGGNIQGAGVSNDGGCFTSQLNVTITPSVVGMEVLCVHDNTSTEIVIGRENITVTTGDDLMAPGRVSLIAATPTQLSFNWTGVTHSCSAVNYTLTTSGCGDCAITTTNSSATCLIPALRPSEGMRPCMASVQAVVCGNIQGVESEASTFQLRVPDAPQSIIVIPSYAQENKTILSVSVNFSEPSLNRPISGYVTGYPEKYTILYTNSTSGDICNISLLTLDVCSNQMCSSTFYISSSLCPVLTDISVTVFASSALGNGARSNELIVDAVNSFVVMSDLIGTGDSSMIFCIFSGVEEGADLSCSISYSKCEHQDLPSLQRHSNSSSRDGDTLQIDLNFGGSGGGVYCYTATASIGSYVLDIEGTFSRDVRSISDGAIVGIVLALLVAVMVGIAVIVLVIVRRKIKKKETYKEIIEKLFDADEDNVADEQRFRKIQVHIRCDLKWLMNHHKLFYKPGCVYYEFTRQVETIEKDKDIIFQEKDTSRLFRSKNGHDSLLSGASTSNKIHNPNFKQYRVFVQSKGIGHRSLFRGTSILYDTEVAKVEEVDTSKITSDDLMNPERRRKFRILQVQRDCSLIEFIGDQSGLQFRPGCAFFEFVHDWEDIDKDKEVIFMDENNELYTGPNALQMINAPQWKIPRPRLSKWKVFVQSRHYGSRHLPANSTLLYEVKSDEDEFESISSTSRVINKTIIPKGCQLRDFVKDHPDLEYEDVNVKLFFEFTSNAEFISEETEILLMNKDGNLFTGDKVKEFVGASLDCGQRVNYPQLKSYRIFISNSGSGTRYLEPSSYLLWEETGTEENDTRV